MLPSDALLRCPPSFSVPISVRGVLKSENTCAEAFLLLQFDGLRNFVENPWTNRQPREGRIAHLLTL